MTPASKRSSSPWVTYLLKRVPEGVKADIADEAQRTTSSHSNVVRAILCDHFGMDCQHAESRGRPPFWPDRNTLFLRLQPELFSAIKQEAASRNAPMRDVVMEILRSHYNHNGRTPE